MEIIPIVVSNKTIKSEKKIASSLFETQVVSAEAKRLREKHFINAFRPKQNSIDITPVKSVNDIIQSRVYYTWNDVLKFKALLMIIHSITPRSIPGFTYIEDFCFDVNTGSLTFYHVNASSPRAGILPAGQSTLSHSRFPFNVIYNPDGMKETNVVNNMYMLTYDRREDGFGEYEWMNNLFAIIQIKMLPQISKLVVYPPVFSTRRFHNNGRAEWEKDYMMNLMSHISPTALYIHNDTTVDTPLQCARMAYIMKPTTMHYSIFLASEHAQYVRASLYTRYHISMVVDKPDTVNLVLLENADAGITIENKAQLLVALTKNYNIRGEFEDLSKSSLEKVVRRMSQADILFTLHDSSFQNAFLMRPHSVLVELQVEGSGNVDWNEMYNAAGVIRDVITLKDIRESGKMAYVNSVGTVAKVKSGRVNTELFLEAIGKAIKVVKEKYV